MSVDKNNFSIWVLLIGLVSFNVEAEPLIPDAGHITRELQREQRKRQEQKFPESPAPLTAELDTPTTAQMSDNMPIAINEIRVTGSNIFSAESLQILVADLAGGIHTLAELEAGAGRISAYYRERGYFLSSAYIPAQDIQDGVLNIAVLEGFLDQVRVSNTARVSDAKIFSHLNNLNIGHALQKSVIDRQLLLLRGTIGIDKVHASLQGGSRAGASDLLVETTPSAPYDGRVQIDNYGNRYTGEYGFGASININSPLKLGDQLTAQLVGSSNNLMYGRIAYQVPFGGDGLHIGAAYSYSYYQLGREFKSLDSHGTSESGSLFATYPLLLSQTSSLFGAVTFENKNFNDRMDSVFSETDKQVRRLSFGLSGDHADTFGVAGRTSFDIALYGGHLNMDAIARQIDDASARSNGYFAKASFMLHRLQRVTDNDALSVSFTGQIAGGNLNSSEKYSLGGSYGVRAYPQGEASGDAGSMLNIEFIHNFMPQLRGVLFYDYGHIKINQNNFLAADNTRTLAGAGLGVNATLSGWQLNSYVAWPMQGGMPLSEPVSSEHIPRLWVQMSGEF